MSASGPARVLGGDAVPHADGPAGRNRGGVEVEALPPTDAAIFPDFRRPLRGHRRGNGEGEGGEDEGGRDACLPLFPLCCVQPGFTQAPTGIGNGRAFSSIR